MASAKTAAGEMVSFREFARLCGCDEKTVRNAVRSGALPRNPGCLLPAALATTAWRARGAQTAEIALARLRRGQFQRRAAAWVSREMAAAGWLETVRAVRQRLSQVAPAVAPLIVGKRAGEMQALIAEAVNAALTDLCSAEVRPTDTLARPADPVIEDTWTRLAAEKAKLDAITRSHELTIAIEAGEAVNIDALCATMGAALAILRTGLLNLQVAMPPRLLGCNRATAEQVIGQAVSELLDELPTAAALLRGTR